MMMKWMSSRTTSSRRLLWWGAMLLILVFSNVPLLLAQGGGRPERLAQGGRALDQIEMLTTGPIDLPALLAEDVTRAAAGLPPRFAQSIAVQISPAVAGTWETLKEDRRLWRLRIHAPDALSINLGFTQYKMPPDGQLFLYTPDYQTVIGPFTAADNEDHGQLWTPILPGQEVVIEVSLPADQVPDLKLALTSVNHGYVEFGQSSVAQLGQCHVDVVCGVADPWQDEIRSVGVYTLQGPGGTLVCSGALINSTGNTAQELTPYFLTAEHCLITVDNAPSMVVYWNYENSECRLLGSVANGEQGDGSFAQFNSGAIWRAGYSLSDMTLVELDDPVDPTFQPHFAGWDRTDVAPGSATAIHHPQTFEKRISFEDQATSITFYGGTPNAAGSHIRVADWDLGSTESGSSGSPLFNQDHRIVGQLEGGDAACTNDSPDWYGRLFTSWTGGGTSDTRLSDWLDPLNSGATVLNGQDIELDFDITLTPDSLAVCAPNEAVYQMALTSTLSLPPAVTLSTTGQPGGTTVTISPNPITPPASGTITVGNTGAAVPGSYALNVVGTSLTRTVTRTVTLDLFDSSPDQPILATPADGALDVATRPDFSWFAAGQSQSYWLEVATDAGFNNVVYTSVVTGSTGHRAEALLAPNTPHYWRVRSQNVCGNSTPSAVYSFTTVYAFCSLPNLAIPDGVSGGISDTITISDPIMLFDLDVLIQAEHSYVGDLSFTLEQVDTGASAVLIDRPGRPDDATSGFGCKYDDIDVILNDDAASPIEDACDPNSVPTIAGELRPNNPLGIFNGESLDQTWRLIAADHQGGDSGLLSSWCLLPNRSTLSITKTGPMTATESVPFSYTLSVINTTSYTATNVVITDVVPLGADYVSGGSFNPDSGVVSWTLTTLPGFGGTAQVSLVVMASVGTVTNTDYGVQAGDGITVLGNMAVTTRVEPALSITKTGPATAIADVPFSYTLTVINAGYTATNVVITDVVPLGATYLSGGSLQVGDTLSGGVVSWTLDTLPGFGGTAQVAFSVVVPSQTQSSTRFAPINSNKIVGGFEANPGDWPWMVSVQKGGGHWCGGSLIRPEWVLTAAHCTNSFQVSDFKVVLGRHNLTDSDGQEIAVVEIVQHPDYNSVTTDNDIALLRLAGPANQPMIALTGPTDAALFSPGITATVTGWGALSAAGPSPDTLHQVSLPLVSNETCNGPDAYDGWVTENMLCAGLAEGGKDSCQGDSGGPLMVPNATRTGWLQAGIVSWGIGCAEPNKYGVYTHLAQYWAWLIDQVGPPLNTISNDDYGVRADGGKSVVLGKTAVVTVISPDTGQIYLPLVLK